MRRFSIVLFLLFVGCLIPTTVSAALPTITDYWNGHATLTYLLKLTEGNTGWTSGFDAGVHMEIVGNIWYLFTRNVEWGDKPTYCPTDLMHMEIRKSSDNGISWSAPISILENTPNTPYECAATDGDAYYNPTENRWHYLYQCLARTGGWNGCHATRNGADPYGPFTPSPDNPVITSGEIWSSICTDASKDCVTLSLPNPVGHVIDEGTFDIFDYQNGSYFVDFHGFDGVNGYRGIAKTADFQTWIPIASDTVLDAKDALPFTTAWEKQKPVGFGAGRITKDQGYYYLISEASDKSIGCVSGQHWVVGMFRSQALNTTTWRQLPSQNPFFTVADFPNPDLNPLPCNPEYSGLFTDENGRQYFHTGRPSFTPDNNGIYFYTFTPKKPGDLTLDGIVDIFDYNELVTDFGKIGSNGWIPADIDFTGTVDIFDYNALVGNFGKT